MPQDIGTAATNISLTTGEGHHARSNCIALFDQTYGSLRLTERVYTELAHLVDRFRVAADAEKAKESIYLRSVFSRLDTFLRALPEQAELTPITYLGKTDSAGLLKVYTPGSRVGLREKGVLFTDVEILAPTIFPDGTFMYQVKCPPKYPGSATTKRWVNPEFLEPSAEEGEWSFTLWDPESQEYVEEDEQEDAEGEH